VKNDPLLLKFGRLAAKQRKAVGISQEELAHRADLDRTYISGLERGVRNPSLTALCKLSAGLGVSVGQMLCGLQSKARSSEGAENV
jgi:transcriptional regulator with XRE-family HTH domain